MPSSTGRTRLGAPRTLQSQSGWPCRREEPQEGTTRGARAGKLPWCAPPRRLWRGGNPKQMKPKLQHLTAVCRAAAQRN